MTFNVRQICWLVLFVCIAGCLHAGSAIACRFNVREIGFVDLGIEPYYLVGYVNKDTPAEVNESLEETSYAALMDSNIQIEMVDVDNQKDHAAFKYVGLHKIESFPAAVLVSPDGQSLPVSISEPDKPFKETLWSALDDILSSPTREQINRKVVESYGVVLLIEGTDAEENQRAKLAASKAIENIAEHMDMLPKPIANPPVLIVLDPDSLSEERVLLWSMGLGMEKSDKPRAAVLYGKARWIGPMFEGEAVTEENLTAILAVIGDDCECGLDQRWLQGTMLPARWDEQAQELIAKDLGYDPENPMIKMEIASIVRRGYSYYPSVPFGYEEISVEPPPPDSPAQIRDLEAQSDATQVSELVVAEPPSPNLPSGVRDTEAESDATLAAQQIVAQPHAPNLPSEVQSAGTRSDTTSASTTEAPVSEDPVLAEGGTTLRKSLYVVGGFALLVLVLGLSIVLRGAKRNV
ncbi:MAG: hypothetical protein JSU70_12845 [Phycisphaerales bacterium]|nr:MAG: hypothetical protein JSU70_12845 [Phycisphaerales bacterium]